MEKLQQILTLAGTALPLLAAAVTFLCKFVKNEKVKKALWQSAKIAEAIQPLIIKAEKFTHYTGEEKKQYVLTEIARFAADNKISFDYEKTGELIDELVATTKNVNSANAAVL